MKKQLFSLIAMLAIVVLAATSANAQAPGGTGSEPDISQLFAVGATGQFTITPSAATNWIAWDIYEVDPADPIGTVGNKITEADGPANGIDFVSGLGVSTTAAATLDGVNAATAYVKFYAAAPTAGYVYAIQATEYEGGDASAAAGECISIRRVYVSVFDFEVDIFFCAADGDTTAAPYTGNASNGDIAFRNNWHNSIIQNSMGTTWLNDATSTGTSLALDSLNNDVDKVGKGDTLYFAVTMDLTGLPANYGLDDMNWRFDYSTPTHDFTINRIEALDLNDADEGLPTFYGEATTPSDWGDDGAGAQVVNGDISTTFPVSTDYDAQNSILIPNRTTDNDHHTMYVFRMTVHKHFPETLDEAIALQVDQVQLKMDADGLFNDGTKDNDGLTTTDVDLLDGTTGTYTIYSSPATSVITITR